MIDNTFSALFSSSIIRPLLFSCAIWSAMLIGCLLYFIFLKTKVPPWFAIQVGSVVETVGAKIRTFSILTKYFLHTFLTLLNFRYLQLQLKETAFDITLSNFPFSTPYLSNCTLSQPTKFYPASPFIPPLSFPDLGWFLFVINN